MYNEVVSATVANLNMAGANMRQNVFVGERLYGCLTQKQFAVKGFSVNVHNDPFLLFRELPDFVKFEGVMFRLELRQDALLYVVADVEPDSKHAEQVREFGCFENPLLDGHNCGFLKLWSIGSLSEFARAVEDCKEFLIENKLI